MIRQIDEIQLIELAQTGDAAAFEALVNRYAQYVYNLALRILQNRQDAEDLSQEAFVRIWKALPKFRSEARFSTWIYRIVANLCYDRLPHIKKEFLKISSDNILEQLEAPEKPCDIIQQKELQTRLHKAIDNLPDSYRLLITLRHLQDMSYNEIAEVTNQPLGTIKTGIFRARQILQKTIMEYEAHNE